MLMVALGLLLALAPVQAFNRGNQLYAHKDYALAAEAYREALRGGHDARIDYNLGNALFKSGRIGEAIVAYRRARSLAPRDADIAENLAFARAYRLDKVAAGPGPIARAIADAFHLLSRRESAIAAAVLCLLASLALAAWIVRRGRALAVASGVLGLVALLSFATRSAWDAEVKAQPAVVVVPELSATSGPGEEFKQILLVHDGSELQVREARGEYLLVQLPGGAGGWVRKDAVEHVY
jgi:tetratricopeptide (TPR) repeat protein